MPLNVTDFRGHYKGGGARPSLFRIRCFAPGYVNFPSEKFTFLANAASIPGAQLGQRIVSYMGQDIKIAGDRFYPDFDVQVLNDEDFAIRDAVERWNNSISQYSREDAVRVDGATSDPSSYVGKIYVDQLGKDGNVIKTYGLVNAWPAMIGGIGLAWQQKDDVELFTISWRYDYIENEGVVS